MPLHPVSRVGINMDKIKNFHSQQDCLGCVDDEANIVNKCDARRQVVSGNEMFFLSKEWDRLIPVLTAVYEDLLRGEQVDVLTVVYKGLLNSQAHIDMNQPTSVNTWTRLAGSYIVHGCYTLTQPRRCMPSSLSLPIRLGRLMSSKQYHATSSSSRQDDEKRSFSVRKKEARRKTEEKEEKDKNSHSYPAIVFSPTWP